MRGPLMYVEVNPGAESSKLAPLDGLRPVDEGPGTFLAGDAGQQHVHAPFCKVHDESYGTYFEEAETANINIDGLKGESAMTDQCAGSLLD